MPRIRQGAVDSQAPAPQLGGGTTGTNAARATIGETRPGASPSTPGAGFRLRFAALVALVAVVPLGVAAWAVVSLVATNELDKADANLLAVARVARAEFSRQVQLTARNAEGVARLPSIQRALRRDDRDTLQAYALDHPRAAFRRAGAVVAGRVGTDHVVTRTAEVTVGGRTIGAVVLSRPLDPQLLDRISRPATASSDDRIVLVDRGRIVAGDPEGAPLRTSPGNPVDVRVGGADYRAFGVRLPEEDEGAIVALRSRDEIEAAVDRTRWFAVAAGLVTLATVAALAYLAAPLVAGRRWVRRLLPRELEEQYALEVAHEEPVVAPASEGAPRVRDADRRRVIVIDGDAFERTLIADALGADHVEVAATGDADHGLSLLGAGADLAILDWKLSGRAGAEVLAELNIRHPGMPVLVVADELGSQQRHVASLLGAGDFLVRPLEPAAVAAKAQELLAGSQRSPHRAIDG